jgi:hemerythrin-like domain-containing protein
METEQRILLPPPHPVTGVDVRDMLVAHQAMLREFRLAPAAVQRTAPGDRRQASHVRTHLRALTRLLHHHHDGEDRLLWPRLYARVPEQLTATVTVMETQHEAIRVLLDSVNAQLPAWSAHPDVANRDRVADTLTALSTALDQHLAAEERDVLPLAAAHLTVAEWQELERDGFDAIPKNQVALMIGMLMYEGDPEVVRLMLGRGPAPARVVMPFLAPRIYARRARRIHGTPTP